MAILLDNEQNAIPTFGSHQKRDKSESIEDFVPQTYYEKYVENEKKKNLVNNQDVNKKAIESIPIIPDFALQEMGYSAPQLPEWYRSLNVASEDEIEEWKKKGKIGLAETWQKKKKWEMVPVSGSSAEMTMLLRNANTLRKIKNGEQVSAIDEELLVDMLRDIKEEEVRGGHTWLGSGLQGLMTSIPYMGEFAAAVALSETPIGWAGLGATISKAAARKAAKKAIQAEVKRLATESLMTGVKKNITGETTKALYNKALKDFAGGEAKQVMKSMSEVGGKAVLKEFAKETPKAVYTSGKAYLKTAPQEFVKDMASRQLSTGVYVTDAGDAAFLDSENFATSFFKSIASGTFEYLTETSGWMFAPVTSYFAKPIQKMMPKKFFTEFEKLVSSQFGMKASDAFRKYGYDGVISEMGEELLNRFLCQMFGVNGLEEYNLDGFLRNVLYADDLSQWGSEALSFAAMSGAGHTIYGVNSKVTERRNKREFEKLLNASPAEKFDFQAQRTAQLQNEFAKYLKENPIKLSRKASPEEFEQKYEEAKMKFLNESGMSLEEFYLNQGFIKIAGSQSAAEQVLRKKLEEQGVDKNVVDDFMNVSSELEKRSKLKEIIEAEEGDIEKRREKAIQYASDKWYTQGGIKDKETSDMAAEITVDLLERISEAKGISIDKLIEDEIPDIETRSEEERYQDMADFYEDYAERNGLMQEAQKLYQEMNELDKTGTEYNEPTININGVDRQTTNSEGRPIAKTKEAIEYFYNWFGDSKAVDEEGRPIVVYHGSVNTFEIFDKRKASPEGDMGAGFYFTSSEWDADDNYHGGGPDFENKVARLAEQLQAEDEELDYDEAKEQAEAQLMGEPHQFACYLKMENPCYIGENETRLLEDIYERVAEINEEDYEDYDEYEQARMEAEDEALNDIAYDIDAALGGFNISYDDAQAIKQAVFDGIYESGVSVEELKKKIAEIYVEDNEGNLVNNEVVRSVVEALGYDGIIDTTVADKFNMNIPYGTAHYIVFNPEQIKSVDNRGTFDANNPNIYYQSAYHGTPHKFDEFSTENIGTGEGNQAHGWGLYFAADKEVSDSYRAGLTEDILYPDKILVNDTEYVRQGKPLGYYDKDGNAMPSVYSRAVGFIRDYGNAKMAAKGADAKINLLKRELEMSGGKRADEIKTEIKEYEELKNVLEKDKIKEINGQLFEVDVPEDKVLLDEDKNFREQPEKVRKAIIKLAHDEKIPISYFANASGKEIYERIGKFISMKIGRAEKTSKLLNEYGVKGITYDGKQDGRCYVVFDDKAIKVLKKYYQTGIKEIDNSKTYNNLPKILKDAVDFIFNTESVSNLKGTEFEKDENSIIDNVVDFYNKNYQGKVINSELGEVKLDREGVKDSLGHKIGRKKAIAYAAVPEVIKNGFIFDRQTNWKNRGYDTVVMVAPITIANENYVCEVVVKQGKERQGFYLHEVELTKKLTDVFKTANGSTSMSSKLIIARNIAKFNPEIYKQDENPADVFKNVKGYYIPAERLIVLLKNADTSTIAHEIAHFYLDLLVKHSDNEEIAADLAEVRKFVKNQGEPFTEEQHEKFARGFEAYIRSGYAKTNRLKKIFEDLKNLFLSIYDSIKNIVYKEDGVNKTFTEEELKNIEDLFDRLLTTERERIKSTVFDKISEIDNKIEEIKNHEAEEFKELDYIWRENIALMNRKSDKKRSVQEYIELAEKMTSRETKEVKEWKKRYKDATLDILCAVSGKPRSWVANSRNWEKLQEIIGSAGDEITTSTGFAPEWSEFYADTGVSYENDEIDGDYKLAEQAFNVMTEGSYDRVYGENYEFADIDRYIAKLDYLAAKVKTLKGTEKEAAFEAFCTVFGKMPEMPEEIAAEIAQKIPELEQEYEEQQKDDFNRLIFPSLPVVQQLQFYITKKLSDLKVYNPETRYKMRLNRSHRLYRYIKDIKSVDSAKKQIRRINDFVIDDMRNNQRSLLHKEIQKQIKVNSKVVKVGSLTKGKFDWKTNTVFAELVQLNKLSREEAEKLIGSMINIDNAANSEARESFDENDSGEFNKTNNFQDVLKNEFLQYRSQRLQDLDVTHTIQLLQDILELKQKGREAKSEEEFLKKTQRWNTKNNLLEVLEQTKQSGAKFGANWIAGVGRVAGLNGGVLANWESLLNAIFNKETAQKYSLLGDEARSEVYARQHMLHFYKKAIDIYGFKAPSNWDKFIDFDYMQPIIDLMREYDNEKYTYTQRVFSINTPSGYAESSIEISRAQMITMYAWSLNDELEQRLFNQFGVTQIMDMFESKLSKADKELAWALVDTCETMREDINEVFIRTTGLSLPKVQNYFPSKAERVQSDIDLYHDFFVKSSNPSFIKQRKSCHRIPMKPMAPLEILIPHINKTAKYVILSEKTNFMNQVFKDTAIKTKMQEIWGTENGSKIYQTLINKLAACTFTNYARGTNLVASALDTVSRNYITSRIGFSGKVALGQLLSVVNYAENMPAGVWAKGFIDTMKHPVESFKYMLENCEYLQSRLAGNTQNEIISILTSEKDRFRKLRNFMSTNTKWGDMIAITLGGKPYVDYLIANGMTKEEAFDKFLEDTLRAQQAGTTSSISEWQAAQARNCLTRMIFAFQNTTIQYERKFVDTLIQAKKGEISKKEAIKKLFIYKILNPIMFTSFLGNLSLIALFRGIAGGDDDAPEGFLKSIVEAIVLSGMGAYGFAGFFSSAVIESIIANLDSGYKHFEKEIPIYSEFNKEIQKWVKGDLEFADYVDALALVSDYGMGIAGTKAVNVAEGAGDFIQGDFGVGLSRMAGWGEYTSTYAWTGKKPKKKKKRR